MWGLRVGHLGCVGCVGGLSVGCVWLMSVGCVLGVFEGVGRSVVEAGVGEDAQGAHCGEDDKGPEEEAVHHHGNVLPVLPQLGEEGREKRRSEEHTSELQSR